LDTFRRASKELDEVWALALQPETRAELRKVSALADRGQPDGFHLENELWVRLVMDFAVAWLERPAERGVLLRSLTPLYLARVASFVIETRDLVSDQVEEKIENLCLCFEKLKPYLSRCWDQSPAARRKKAGSVQKQRDTTQSDTVLEG